MELKPGQLILMPLLLLTISCTAFALALSTLQRLNAVSALATSVVLCLLGAISLSTFFISHNPSAALDVHGVNVYVRLLACPDQPLTSACSPARHLILSHCAL